MLNARTSRGVRTRLSCAIAGCALGLCGPAHAAMTLRMDLNSIVVQAAGGFTGASHTGLLELSMDDDASIAGVRIDDVSQDLTAGLADVTGEIRLENGQVVGGRVLVTLTDSTTYTAEIGPDLGGVTPHVAQGFSVDGLTEAGDFEDLTDGMMYGGVDVSDWLAGRGSLPGSFYLFAFDPRANGTDRDTNLELYLTAVAPSPGSVALGALAVAFSGIRRRRTA